jgi:6-phosphofructokinase
MHNEHCTLFRLLASWNVVSHCKDMVICGEILTSSAHRRYNYVSHIQVSCSPCETTRCEGRATGADAGKIILNACFKRLLKVCQVTRHDSVKTVTWIRPALNCHALKTGKTVVTYLYAFLALMLDREHPFSFKLLRWRKIQVARLVQEPL